MCLKSCLTSLNFSSKPYFKIPYTTTDFGLPQSLCILMAKKTLSVRSKFLLLVFMAISCPVSGGYGGCFIPFLLTYFIFYLFHMKRLISLQTLFFKIKYIPNKINGRIPAFSSIRKISASLRKSCDDILQALALFTQQIVVSCILAGCFPTFVKHLIILENNLLQFFISEELFLVLW